MLSAFEILRAFVINFSGELFLIGIGAFLGALVLLCRAQADSDVMRPHLDRVDVENEFAIRVKNMEILLARQMSDLTKFAYHARSIEYPEHVQANPLLTPSTAIPKELRVDAAQLHAELRSLERALQSTATKGRLGRQQSNTPSIRLRRPVPTNGD